MANPEDEEHHLFKKTSSEQQRSNIWNLEQSTALNSNDEIDAVARPNQRVNAISFVDNRHQLDNQLNKREICECCYSTDQPITLSSSIVHIDENESDDEYLDAENYQTAHSTLDDLTENDDQNNLKIKNFTAAISSNPFFNQLSVNNNNQKSIHCEMDNNELNHSTINSSSLCKSDSSSSSAKPVSTLITSTNTASIINQQNNKCHCRLNNNNQNFAKPSRPLSLSSISSSSSSCCSLSRNNSLALSDHLKKPYLASIESLGDDEVNGGNKYSSLLNSDEHCSSSGISSGCHSHCDTNSASSSTEPSVHSTCSCCVLRSNSNLSLVRSESTTSSQSQCRCNHMDNYEQEYSDKQAIYYPTISNVNTLSQMDRVIMEIVQTETAYVKDLNEIIEGYFVYLNKRLFESSELKTDYESDEGETTNEKSKQQTKRNAKQRNASKQSSSNNKSKSPLFGNLNNQFNLDETTNQINQTSHTLPKASKQQPQASMKKQIQVQSNQTHCVYISEEQLVNLFSNLNDIYQFNSLFLNQLLQCDFEPVQIAQCFVDNEEGFHVYSQYCTNYPKQVETLSELNRNPNTNQLLKTRQIELGHSLPLFSFILKPVQRILKYHLLLNNMVKYFELEQSNVSEENKNEDAERSLRNALNVMTNIAAHINTMKKKHEHAVRVQEIQSLLIGWPGDDLTTFGELVAEGTFKMFGNKTSRHLFLFDKMLLVVKKKDDSLFTYKAHILCSNLMLIESIRSEPLCFHAIPFNNPKVQYTFIAKNLDQKREWCLLLKNVILESFQAIPSHAKEIVLGLGQKTSSASTENKHHKVFPVHLNRKLSAPEYLEKRCKAQQNKISSNNLVNQCNQTTTNGQSNNSLGLQFSNLQKGFKLRKSLKKVQLISGRNSTIIDSKNCNNDTLTTEKTTDMKVVDESTNCDLQMHLINDHNNDLNKVVETNELISSYEESNQMEVSYSEKLVANDIIMPSCLSSTSLTTTNDSYTDSGVGSQNSVCCYSQLTTPISLGSSIASIESNVTTTTANSYSTGYSHLSGSTNSSKLVNLQCSSIIHPSMVGNQSSTDDFNELMITEQNSRDHDSNIRLSSNGIRQQTFKNKRCTNRCCLNDLANRYKDLSPSTSLSRFDSKSNYLHHHSKFYRHSKYMHLNHPSDETEFRLNNSSAQVRRVQSFTSGNKNNLNSRLLTNYSTNSSNKSFALNACSDNSNGSALLQHTVSFRKTANVDLVLAKFRHLHRPSIVVAQKRLYKQQKMQQLNELKMQELNLNSKNEGEKSSNEVENKSNEDEKRVDKLMKSNNKLSKTKSIEDLSPTSPQIWLKKHEKHYFKDNMNLKKGGSLPRSFEGFL